VLGGAWTAGNTCPCPCTLHTGPCRETQSVSYSSSIHWITHGNMSFVASIMVQLPWEVPSCHSVFGPHASLATRSLLPQGSAPKGGALSRSVSPLHFPICSQYSFPFSTTYFPSPYILRSRTPTPMSPDSSLCYGFRTSHVS